MKIVKILLVIILILAVMCTIFIAGAGLGAYYVMSPVGGGKTVRVDIIEGDSGRVVAEKLQDAGVIKNALLFRLLVRFSGSGAGIKTGSFMINSDDNMMQILEQLKRGQGVLRFITIPEGLTLKEVASLMEEKGVVGRDAFLRAASDKLFKVNGEAVESVEGYLLPDTYDLPAEFSATDVINTMIGAFNDKVVPMYEKKKKNLPYPLSLAQVVTLASLVEREAQLANERPIIATVYYNRLKKGMKLECDATIQYALGKPRHVLKYSDLRIKSPYNTYLHGGLPPGPIANPGLDSIKAVLEPERNDYLYYVRNDVKNDGSHVFSKTFNEHQAAIDKHQK